MAGQLVKKRLVSNSYTSIPHYATVIQLASMEYQTKVSKLVVTNSNYYIMIVWLLITVFV